MKPIKQKTGTTGYVSTGSAAPFCAIAFHLALVTPGWTAPPCEALPAPKFSFDRDSPSVLNLDVNQNSMLIPTPGEEPPTTFLDGANLGLGPNDDLDGLSASYHGLPLNQTFVLLFSVDRATQGSSAPDPAAVGLGTPYNVSHQAERNQQAGDQYLSLRLFNRQGVLPFAPRGPATNNNTLSRNNWDEGGTDFNAKPPTSAEDMNTLRVEEPQDNVDAMATIPANEPGDLGPVFFSIESSAIPGRSGADVIVDLNPQMPGGEFVYLQASFMGLNPNTNDIDGLIVFDDGNPGVAEPGDQVLFTLRPDSEFLLQQGLTGADVLSYTVTTDGPGTAPVVFASAQLLGLGGPMAVNDSIDALDLSFCDDALACAARNGIRLTNCAPTVSARGLAALGALLVAAGVVVFRRRELNKLSWNAPADRLTDSMH